MKTAGGIGYRLGDVFEMGAGFQNNGSLVFMLSNTMITVVNNYLLVIYLNYLFAFWVVSGTPRFKNERQKWMNFFLPVNSDEKPFIHASPMI